MTYRVTFVNLTNSECDMHSLTYKIGPEAPPGGHFWQIVCERSRVADLFERPLAWPILEYWSRNAPRWPFWANFCERSRMAVLCECPLVANFGRLAWEYPLVPDLSRLVLDRPLEANLGIISRRAPVGQMEQFGTGASPGGQF